MNVQTAGGYKAWLTAMTAISNGELSLTSRCLVAWLALAHNGSAWLHRSDIADSLRLSKDAVDDSLRQLQRLGWLTVSGAPQGSKRQRWYALSGASHVHER